MWEPSYAMVGIHTSEQLAETKCPVPCPGETELNKRLLASVFVESQEEGALPVRAAWGWGWVQRRQL